MVHLGAKKRAYFYECKKCDYKSNKKSHYERHLQTKKHNDTNGILNDTKKGAFLCKCGKSYKFTSGLYRHKSKCDFKENETQLIKSEEPDYKQMFLQLMEQNQKILETTVQIAKEPKIINNNNNKNQFNILNYLNTECKDALNLTDFINQLKYTFNDLLQLPDEGWQENVTNTFVSQLKQLEENKRPIHCSDKKRKTFYIKDDDVWNKDNNQSKIQNGLKQFHDKQCNVYMNWKQQNKDELYKFDNLQDKSMFMNIELCKPNINGEKMKNKIINQLSELTLTKTNNLIMDS